MLWQMPLWPRSEDKTGKLKDGGRGGRGCGAVGWSLKGGDMGLLLTPMLLEAGIDLSASCGCFEDK